MDSKVFNIISRIMGAPLERITESSSPDSIEQWDSLKHIQLILAIEEAFGVQLTDQEVVSVRDVRSIIALLRQKAGA